MGSSLGGWGWEGQCGCEIEVIVKIKKRSVGVRADVNEKLKIL